MTDVVRVLLVDDDEDDYLLTRDLLADVGAHFAIDWASTRAAGMEKLAEGDYDVALVDYQLGGDTGVDLLREACAHGCRVPVIMLTGQSDRATDLAAMHAGASDYLVKGRVTGDMLERAIRYARERHRLNEEIRSLSLTDELTRLANRRGFFTLAEERLQLLQRRGASCLLVYADVDGLKVVNDTMGHQAGDRLLVEVANVLRATFRRTDLVARLGGDEFVVLADEAGDQDIPRILVRLEQQIAEKNAGRGVGMPGLSVSAGAVAFRSTPGVTLQELLADADTRMLRAKQQRRRPSTPA